MTTTATNERGSNGVSDWLLPNLGVPVIVSDHLPTTRREQFRFPRSKKRRIRRKWAKNPRNYREVDCSRDVYLVGQQMANFAANLLHDKFAEACGFQSPQETLVLRREALEELQKQVAVIRNVGEKK